ncbi:MAG: signal peptidase I [Anaerolineae bacterium]
MEETEILAETEDLGPEPGMEKPRQTSNVGRLLLRALWDLVSTLVPAIVIALFINVFVAQAMVVQGPSMQPNLYYDQRVMVEKVTYRLVHGPRRGDVVIVEVPGEEEPLIKRVVALSGETVEVQGGYVFINGQLLEEPWATQQGGLNYASTLVPPLHVFVLGDNRGSSRDSRSFGPVSVDQLIGRAWLIYWPLDQVKLMDE